MATKTLTITEDAYELLAAHKSPLESFCDVIRKHFQKESLLTLAGMLTTSEADELRKHIAKRRTASRTRIEKIRKHLS